MQNSFVSFHWYPLAFGCCTLFYVSLWGWCVWFELTTLHPSRYLWMQFSANFFFFLNEILKTANNGKNFNWIEFNIRNKRTLNKNTNVGCLFNKNKKTKEHSKQLSWTQLHNICARRSAKNYVRFVLFCIDFFSRFVEKRCRNTMSNCLRICEQCFCTLSHLVVGFY